MNVPQLRFKEFSGEWETKQLGKILTIGSGKDYKHLDFGDIPVFGTGGLMTTVNSFLYDGETVCIGRKGTIDKPMYFNGKFWTVDTLFYTHSFRNVLPKFVFSLFQCINWKEHNEASGVPSLSKSTIEKINLNIPTVPEQTKIANFLTTIDERINQLTRKKELMTQYKQGVMQQIFSQQLRFKDDNGKDFGDWEEKKLEEVSTIFMGSSPKSEFYNEDGNGLPLLQGNADIKNRKSAPRIFTSEITRECLPDDILLSVRAPVGSVAISNHYACIGRGIAAIRANSKISQIFIYQWLLNFEEKWKSFSQGSTFDSVNSDDIKNFKVTFPTLAEQTKIANFLTTLDEKIQHITQQIEVTKQYKQGLLQQMFV